MVQKLTILFDLDGTLVDTAPDLMKAHNHVMRKYGYKTKSTDEMKKLVGRGASHLIERSIWEQAKKEFGQIDDQINKKKMVKDFIDYYGKNIAIESKLTKGVKQFLDWSKQKNISMGVCTNKQDYLAVELLKQINIYDYFEYVAGGNTFDYCKPDPRHLTSVIEIMQGEIKKSIMIGDSETDANSARAAGITFILLKDGYTEKKVSEIYHDHLIKDFKGIEQLINKYLKH
jgi:phosphoglycolate phosphatase